jgi:hypothetical protein
MLQSPNRGDGVRTIPASCEDGSAPHSGSEGFVCGDESEPVCEDGSAPTASSDGSTPQCPVASTAPAAEACADEGAQASGGAAPSCPQSVEPACTEDGQPAGGSDAPCAAFDTEGSTSTASARFAQPSAPRSVALASGS